MSRKSLAAALVTLSVAAVAADSVHLNPGRWEIVSATSAINNGRAIPPAFIPESPPVYRCLPAETAANPTNYFLRATGCGVPQGRAQDGNVRLKTSCKTPNGVKLMMEINGNYTSDSYDVVTHSVGRLRGVTLDSIFHDRGRHVGPCLGDETG